jgi:Protein of unknown function (DUF1499)
MKIAIFILLLLALGMLSWVRLSPNDPTLWHRDPLTATRTASGGWIVRPDGGDAASLVLPGDPAALLLALDRIALATPRTTRFAGDMESGMITYITRSRLLGFPDFTTVMMIPVAGGTSPVLFARQRFGDGDLGVNRARAEDWLARLSASTTP